LHLFNTIKSSFEMQLSKPLRLLIVGVATAVLSACGGGGGGGAGGGGSSATQPTQSANTGLSAPTLTLTQSLGAATPLVNELVLTYALADEAQAARALGSLVPGLGNSDPSPYICGGGGMITYTIDGNGNLAYTYTDCFNGTYTFNGTSQVTPTVTAGGLTSYDISFTGLQVSSQGGLSASVTGSLTCTPAASAGQSPTCTTSVGGYVWGYDISYGSNGTANGTHQCGGCGQTWNVTFNDFTETGGDADIFATNGSAIVTRTGPKTFTVVMFVGNVSESYNVTLN
jgi:hypothetical protein